MKLATLIMTTLFSSITHAGGDVGSGGDLVRCVPSPDNGLFGNYSLDYLVHYTDPENKSNPLAEVTSWEQSMFRIQRLLNQNLPQMQVDFETYTQDIRNTNFGRRYVWEETAFELIDIPDEDLDLAVKIPENCRRNGKVQLIQAVIRQNPEFSGTKNIIFKYMPEVFEKTATNRPLQLSFLLVHEWLWNFSKNVDRNRRVNWFLHSKKFDQMSEVEVVEHLLGMGFDVRQIRRIIALDGSGHFRSLQQAVFDQREGEEFFIREGKYSFSGTTVGLPLKLVGQGDRDKIIIQGSSSQPAAIVSGTQLHAENLSFFTTSKPILDERVRESVIYLTEGSELSCKNCRIYSSANNRNRIMGIRMDSGSKLSLVDSLVHTADTGIGFRGQAEVSIFKSKIIDVFFGVEDSVWVRDSADRIDLIIEESVFDGLPDSSELIGTPLMGRSRNNIARVGVDLSSSLSGHAILRKNIFKNIVKGFSGTSKKASLEMLVESNDFLTTDGISLSGGKSAIVRKNLFRPDYRPKESWNKGKTMIGTGVYLSLNWASSSGDGKDEVSVNRSNFNFDKVQIKNNRFEGVYSKNIYFRAAGSETEIQSNNFSLSKSKRDILGYCIDKMQLDAATAGYVKTERYKFVSRDERFKNKRLLYRRTNQYCH